MKYFDAKELVDPDTFAKHGIQAFDLFDLELLRTLTALREHYGYSMIINNWSMGGSYRYRGYRPAGCGVGSETGAHYKGKAVDVDFYQSKKLVPAATMVANILRDRAMFPAICGLETGVNWNHIDTMNEQDSPRRQGVKDGKIILFNATGTEVKIV